MCSFLQPEYLTTVHHQQLNNCLNSKLRSLTLYGMSVICNVQSILSFVHARVQTLKKVSKSAYHWFLKKVVPTSRSSAVCLWSFPHNLINHIYHLNGWLSARHFSQRELFYQPSVVVLALNFFVVKLAAPMIGLHNHGIKICKLTTVWVRWSFEGIA